MKTREEHLITPLLPEHQLKQVDFEDTFSTTNIHDSLETITNLVFATMPKWVMALMALRNHLVKLIGLKSEKPEDYNEEFKIGGYIGFFKIMFLSDKKIILGANEDHLNFRAIIKLNSKNTFNVCVTTLVEYNNTKGKRYMSIIKPFHRIVVRNMVKQAYKNKNVVYTL